ncbi:hypothetical protein SEUCBS139899_003294 [Sporothrix eucalyptigena]
MAAIRLTQLDHEETEGACGATEPAAATHTVDTVCDRCQKLFGEPSSSYKCECKKGSYHYHLGPIKNFLVGTQSPCPGCRLMGTIVTNSWSMIRRHNWVRPGLDDTRVTVALNLLEEMVSNIPGPGVTLQPVACVLDVVLDGLPILAGTLIKMANNDTPSEAEKVHGLIVPQIIDIERTKGWLATCLDKHDNCRGHSHSSVAGSAPPAIRLIDVDTRQIVSATLADDFVALSYVWGKDTRPLLTGATLPLYEAPGGLDQTKLPRTIADAMRLVRDLSFHYLWVDSLCIVQDDDDDKLHQLPLMAALYEAAVLVIVAAAGVDAEAGLGGYEQETPTRASQTRETINGMTYITTQGGLVDVLPWMPWDRRGWTFQEAFRSRRALVFTDALVYWSCRDATWREDLDSDRGDSGGVRLKLSEGSSLWRFAPGGGRRTIGCTPSHFYTNVEQFSKRAFRDGGDALWAYVAILAHQAPRFEGHSYIWGHPYAGFHASLLWRHDHSCLSHHRRGTIRKDCHSIVVRGADGVSTARLRVPFPSWSWLSSDTGVQFLDKCAASVVSALEGIQSVHLEGNNTAIYLEYLQRIGAEGASEAQQIFDQAGGRLTPLPLSTYALGGLAVNIHYGLLFIKAETAKLTVRRETEHTGDDKCFCLLRPHPGEEAHMVCATVHSADGSKLGSILAASGFFEDEETETIGEFVLLSSNAWPRSISDERCRVLPPESGCYEVKHVDGCAHITSHNLMLVAWDKGDKGVAYRQSLMTMDKAIRDGLSPEVKTKKVIPLA